MFRWMAHNIPFHCRSNPLRTHGIPRGIRREDFAFEEPSIAAATDGPHERVTVRRGGATEIIAPREYFVRIFGSTHVMNTGQPLTKKEYFRGG